MMDKATEDFMLQLFGIKDPDAYRLQQKQEFSDYAHLIETMSRDEFLKEIGVQFGANPKQAALIGAIALYAKVKQNG